LHWQRSKTIIAPQEHTTWRQADDDRGGGPMRALLLANMHYWPTVAPIVARELARWEQTARAISDPALRELALGKLAAERFNAEVAATLATLATRRTRAGVASAIVALELLFDYLDGRTERPSDDPIADGERLFAPFIAAVDTQPYTGPPANLASQKNPDADDGAYLMALSQRTRQTLLGLPAGAAVGELARAAARRCAEAQVRLHASTALGDAQLQQWASAHAGASGLGWREYTGGCASSVLALHALIAAAADPATSAADAQAIDAAYLAIAGVITMLDSVVDRSADSARGQAGFIRLFRSAEDLTSSARALTREALQRARQAPHGEHHVMTLAGVLAYYTSHPGAREPHARATVHAVHAQMPAAIWPALGVMFTWRAAKRVRQVVASGTHKPAPHEATPPADGGI
jgi:tetraprenyl-beta-curcumene synthase